MNYLKPHFSLLHALSQVLYKYLPMDFCMQDEEVQGGALEETAYLIPLKKEIVMWTQKDWWDFVEWSRKKPIFSRFSRVLDAHFYILPEVIRNLHTHLQFLSSLRGSFITQGCENYPKPLLGISDPPLAFSILGNPLLLNTPCVSVIGSRKASHTSYQLSYQIGQFLNTHNFTSVSGGAFGCDIACHKGVLASSGDLSKAIIIFAGGLQNLYPKQHASYFEQILSNSGVLLSERLWNCPSRPPDFPVRNRLISGVSGVTVVLQAEEKSGSMLTANLALDQGRDLLVYAGDPDDIRFAGNQRLLAEGAVAFHSLDDFGGHFDGS